MTRSVRWPSAVFLTAATFILAGSTPSLVVAADPPPLPKDLRSVPANAAVFVHIDVAAIWDSKLGDTFRSVKAKDLESGLADLKKQTTLSPDMIKTATVYMPHLKDTGDTNSVAVILTLRKPYDRAALVKAQKDRLALDKVELTDKDGILRFSPSERNRIAIDATDPNRLAMYTNLDEKYTKDRPAGEVGAIVPALRAAAEGATVAVGLNLTEFPDEIRGDNLPAEVRPFQPLFKSDALIATARLTKTDVQFEFRFRNGDRIKTAEAEKSLAAGTTLIQTVLGFAIEQLKTSKTEPDKAMIPIANIGIEVMKTAKIAVVDNEAFATATVKTDLPYAPLLTSVFGGEARSGAARAQATNNLKQIALAMHNYNDAYEGLPPAAVVNKKGKPLLSWRVLILPYIEHEVLYKQFNLDEAWDSEHNKKVLEKHPMPKVYAFPGISKETDKETCFQVFTGKGAIFDTIQTTKLQNIADGTSNTILIATAAKSVIWTKPDDMEFDPKAEVRKLLLFVNGNTLVAFADGSVRALTDKLDEATYKAIITKDGGEVINLP